ncbi:MAG: hypothetical protein PVJ27_05050, partial [Candidatus Brocadiaceae bacterium]
MADLRVLFCGNSYTFFHGMPQIVQQFAASRPGCHRLDFEMIAPGGCTLERHWEETGAAEAISRGAWDCVVLQEQSTRPIEDPGLMFRYARLLHREAQRVQARAVLFLTWARRDAPEAQRELTAAYRTIARELGATVAPVGIAWQTVLRKRRDLPLHEDDGSHPNHAGAYLTACVFYATLFDAS